MIALSTNKQFEPTVIRRRMRAASAPFHYALAARWTRGRAAAQLRRYATNGYRVPASDFLTGEYCR
jgi:hypothetical protein